MDYEKKLKEALNSNDTSFNVKCWIRNHFPEFSEPEDERIRKDIIKAFKVFEEKQAWVGHCLDDIDWDACIAWLEKQGEQPKKHDVCNNCEQQGSCISPCCVKLVEKNGEQKPVEWSEEDEKKLNTTIAYLLDVEDFPLNAKKCIDWLKELKNRVGCEANCTITWNKAAVVAEIERLKVHSEEAIQEFGREGYVDNVLFEQSKIRICETLLSSLNTIEVKEVDLKKELIEWHKEHFKKDGTFIGMSGFYLTNNSQMDIVKHFFELGMQVSNKQN